MKTNNLCAATLIFALTVTSVSVASPCSLDQSEADTTRLVMKAQEYNDPELEALVEALRAEARSSAFVARLLGLTTLTLSSVVVFLLRTPVSNFLSRCPQIIPKPNWWIWLETRKLF